MNLDDLQYSHKEHQLWLALCRQLRHAGAVTQADLDSPLSARGTPGLTLLQSIRDWGDGLVALRKRVEGDHG
jgi:hypothetical protein